jgi:2-amino-4-hydroxy-6-hydroxymethyldihydropteridine diphosphokinase
VKNVAYLSLGSNLGDRAANLQEAFSRLGENGNLLAVSSIYETAPVEFTAQPWFYNCVAAMEIKVGDMAEGLLQRILSVEKSMGRIRQQDKGPRNIDIDILLFGDQVIDSEHLTIPHPAMHQRLFVLAPLTEIAPEARHPLLEKTARELLASFSADGSQVVRRLG